MLLEHEFSHAGQRLNYAYCAPQGPPLLLLHGVTRSWRTFVPLVPWLESRWQVHALDFRGHGASQPAPGAYRVIDYVADALAILGMQLRQPAVVYGHSLGAMVALAVAAKEPERVRALVLEDPPFDTMGSRIHETALHGYFRQLWELARQRLDVPAMSKALADVRLSMLGSPEPVRLGDLRDAATLRFTARCLARLDPDVLLPIIEGYWLDGYDFASLIRQVRCPTLVLEGDLKVGGMLTPAAARQLRETIGDCTHVPLTGVGHLIHWTETETTARLVTAFLESLD